VKGGADVAQYQGVLFFQASFSGWTEKFYLLSSTPAGAALNLINIANARVVFLEKFIGIIAGVISDVAIAGDSQSVFSTTKLGEVTDANGFTPLDIAVIVKWHVGVFSRNKTFLRGMGASQTPNGGFTPDIATVADLNTWFTVVMANAVFPVTVRNTTPPPTYKVTGYAAATSASYNESCGRRKTGRPLGLPRGRRIAP